MHDFINKIKEIYNFKIEDTSANIYNRYLNKIRNVLEETSYDIKKIIGNPFTVYNEILEFNLCNTVKYNMLIFCHTLSKKLDMNKYITSDYDELLKNYGEKIVNERQNNKIPDKRIKNWAEWSDIFEVFYKIDINNFITCQEKLIVGLYTRLEYVLRLDFCNMAYIKENNIEVYNERKENYIYYNKQSNMYNIILNSYKTSKKYGKIHILVDNQELDTVMRLWFKKYNKDKRWLLVCCRYRNKPMEFDNLSKNIRKIFKKYLDKEISNQILRQSFESYNVYNNDSYSKMTLKEKKDSHKKLLHSLEVGLEYAKKSS